MSLLVALIIGGIVGWVASQLGGRNEGLFASVAIGVVGSVIGGILSATLTGGDYLLFTWPGLFWSFVGSIIFVTLLNLFQRRRTHNV